MTSPRAQQAAQQAEDPSPGASDMLARFRDGDREAFQEIVGAFHVRLVRFFYRLCWDRDRAEDLTQDLFLKLLRGAHGYRPQGRLATFVFRVATNLWIDHYRARKHPARLYSLDQAMLKGEPELSHLQRDRSQMPPAMDRLIQDEEKERLRRALSCLTEPHRLVFELAVYQQLPYAEISRVLEIPVGTVKSRMHNCGRALRREVHAGRGHREVARRPFRRLAAFRNLAGGGTG